MQTEASIGPTSPGYHFMFCSFLGQTSWKKSMGLSLKFLNNIHVFPLKTAVFIILLPFLEQF